MSRAQEVAEVLGCSSANVCRLLRAGQIKGTRKGRGWIVTAESVQEYLAKPKINKDKKLNVEMNQKFGHWTVLVPDPEANKTSKTRMVLCQCV